MKQHMATAPNSVDQLVRANLRRFREEAGLTQAQAADASGVSIHNLTRYEIGKIETVPYAVIAALAPVYGHAMEDFSKPNPPAAKRDDLPVFFLRTREDVTIDSELLMKVQKVIDEANREIRGRRKK